MANISSLLEKNNNHRHILTIAGEVGKDLNMGSYVVGGFVRDALLAIQNSDIDIMVEGDAIKFAKSFSKKIGGGDIVAFEKFGTAIVPYNGMEIEIASVKLVSIILLRLSGIDTFTIPAPVLTAPFTARMPAPV